MDALKRVIICFEGNHRIVMGHCMNSKPPPSAIDETTQLHSFPGRSGLANSIALLIEENEKLRALAALLTSELEVMRGSIKEEAQPTGESLLGAAIDPLRF
jgi:hypothetical protein